MFRNGTSIGKRVGTSFSDSGLTAETAYRYQVKAIGTNDLESEWSEELLVTTDPAPTEGDA